MIFIREFCENVEEKEAINGNEIMTIESIFNPKFELKFGKIFFFIYLGSFYLRKR